MQKIKLTTDLRNAISKAIGTEYSESEIIDNVSKAIGAKVSWYDGGIDDGCDDGKDEYVMKGCFCVENSNITIRVYYGNNTYEIGYVEINDR